MEAGTIAPTEAVAYADNRTDVTLRLRLASGGALAVDDGGMSMADVPTESLSRL